MRGATGTARPAALPTLESVCARHPELPGLAALLDPARRAAVLAPIVGDAPMEVARLRLKPGTSVSLALRPATRSASGAAAGSADADGTAARGWWRVRAFAPEPFAPKAAKERVAAESHRLPVLVDEDLRIVVSPAETDRDLRGLAWLRPDSGCLVAVKGRARTVHTLSYNPDRRWVGVARDPHCRPRSVLRLHEGDRRMHVEPWAAGRPWGVGDEGLLPALRDAVAAGLATRPGRRQGGIATGDADARNDWDARNDRDARLDGIAADDGDARPFETTHLAPAARFLACLDEGWGARADRVVRAIGPRLATLGRAPAHGDLSPDQVVVGEDGAVHVLDWDRAGCWPVGWDAATWAAGSTLFLPAAPADLTAPATPAAPAAPDAPLTDQAPHPAVAAAAALLYTPDPFRRQLPDWAAATERLLARAEEALS